MSYNFDVLTVNREPTQHSKTSHEEFISGLPQSFREVAEEIVNSFYGSKLQATGESGFKIDPDPSVDTLPMAG